MTGTNSRNNETILMEVNTAMDVINGPAPIIRRIKEGLMEKGVLENKVRREIMEITGVSKQNLTHWFNGTTEYPSIEHVIQIAKEFNLDLVWLIMGEKQEKYWGKKEPKENNHSPVNIGHADSVIVNGGMLSEN